MGEIRRFTFSIINNNNDAAEIINKLESTKNMSAYLRELIHDDIHKKQDYNNSLNNLEERLNNLEKRIKKIELNDDNYF